MGGVNEQPCRAVKGLPCVGWYGGGTRGTLDGWGCSDRLRPARGLVLPYEGESELIAILLLLALGHRLPWGVPTQNRKKWAMVEGPPWELCFVVFYKH